MEDSKRTQISGKAISVDGDDIDTDRIIPARFLRCVVFDGLGEHAFEDDRLQMKAQGQVHPFDQPSRGDAEILLVNKNFGCGSSREHAPQALMRWNKGIKAIVGESFAEIFFGNCVALGIPCVTVSREGIEKLKMEAMRDENATATVDLEALTAKLGNATVPVQMADGPRTQLTSGRWDSTAELLAGKDEVAKRVASLPYFTW